MQANASFHVTQTIDTWSLGCVFSMAATWFVLGLQGVAWFPRIRADAAKEASKDASSMDLGDCFHDGREVLGAVRDWHQFLRKSVRDNDCITCEILDIVDGHMLVSDPEKRDTAGTLSTKLQNLLKSAAEKISPNEVPDSIMNSFKKVYNQQSIARMPLEVLLAKYKQLTNSEDRRQRNSDVFELVTNTTRRPSAVTKRDFREGAPKNKSAATVHTESNDVDQSTRTAGTGVVALAQRSKRGQRVNIVRNKQEAPASHIRHDVFEAREALDSGSFSLFYGKWQRKRAEDPLSTHYKDRDIVSGSYHERTSGQLLTNLGSLH